MAKSAAGRELNEALRLYEEGQADLRELALRIEEAGVSLDAEDRTAEALKGLAIQIALRGAELENGQPGEKDRDRLLFEIRQIADRLINS